MKHRGRFTTVERLAYDESEAALAVGLSLAAFRRAVAAGELPKPRVICGVERWSLDAHRRSVDAAEDRRNPIARDMDELDGAL